MDTAVHTDYDAILAAICAEPLELYHRLAMYDYWEERGDTLRLEAWRALEGKFPRGDGKLVRYWWYSNPEHHPTPHVLDLPWVCSMLDDSSIQSVPTALMYFYSSARAFTGAVEGYIRWKRGESN